MKFLFTISLLSICYLLAGQSILETGKLTGSTRVDAPYFGGTISIHDNYAISSAYFDQYDINQGNQLEGAGAAYILEKKSNGNWEVSQKLIALDRVKNQHFGRFVAIDSNYAIVGVNQAYSMLNGISQKTGAVYVFENNNGIWSQTQKLTASDKQLNDNFGISVALLNDTLVIGDYSNSSNSQSHGAVYTFVLNNGSWVEHSKLSSPNATLYMSFGNEVDLGKNSLIVGATGDSYDENGQNMISNSGAVEIYNKNSSGNWVFEKRLVPNNRHTLTRYGSSLQLWENRLIVGAQMEDFPQGGASVGMNTGAAYIYHKSGSNWVLRKKISMPITSNNDYCGAAVGIYKDRAIIGAPFDGDGKTNSTFLDFSGSTLVYEYSNGNWNFDQVLLASDRDSNDHFGHGLAISENDILVGAPGQKHDTLGSNPHYKAGMIYNFQFSNSIDINESGLGEIVFYPNPSNERITFDLEIESSFVVKLFTISGNVLLSKKIKKGSASIDTKNIPSGTYIIQFEMDESIYYSKCIIQH